MRGVRALELSLVLKLEVIDLVIAEKSVSSVGIGCQIDGGSY